MHVLWGIRLSPWFEFPVPFSLRALFVPWLMCANVVVTAAETAAWKAGEFIIGGGGGGGGATLVFLWIFYLGISCYEIGMAMSLWNPLIQTVTVVQLYV